jgi:hypothetical protein
MAQWWAGMFASRRGAAPPTPAEEMQAQRDREVNREQARIARERTERLADRAAQEQYETAQREERARLGRERIARAVHQVGAWFPSDIVPSRPGELSGRPRTLRKWLTAVVGGRERGW